MNEQQTHAENSGSRPSYARQSSQYQTARSTALNSNSGARISPYRSSSTHRERPYSDSFPNDIALQNVHQRHAVNNQPPSWQSSDRVNGATMSSERGSMAAEQVDQLDTMSSRPPQRETQVAFQDQQPESDEESISVRSEHTYLQRRDLGMVDVAALIINKQIGTGIFTTPGLVLSLTGSKTSSIVMWFCGGIWAFLSVIIYVEFGSAFPFNGGELIYLDEIFRKPELLATILFSAFFIFVPNTDGNSLQFAKNVLLAAIPNAKTTEELDKRLISFIAISILTLVCFIHYFSRNSGLFLNLLFAAYKIALIIVFIICGLIASGKPDNGKSDWGNQNVKEKNVPAALIYIIYSYQGWENANYVGGELKVKSQSLKWGAFLAVSLVTLLYTLVTLAYSLACPFDQLVGQDLGVVSNFAPKAFGASQAQGIKICVALSAFGNLIAVVYTSAKVKQQIARQCIIPFYKFFAKEDMQFKTPSGALILHWVMAAIWILCTPNTSSGYGFVIGLFIYGQLVVGFCVGIAFFLIRREYEGDKTRSTLYAAEDVVWHPVILRNKPLRILCALIFIGMNLMVIIEAVRTSGYPPPWVRPVVIFGLLLGATAYWGILRIIEKKSDIHSPLQIRIVKDDGMEINAEDKDLLNNAKRQGNMRIVVYEVHGWLKNWFGSIDVGLHRVFKLLAR